MTKKAQKPALTQQPLVFDSAGTGPSGFRSKDWKKNCLYIRKLKIDGEELLSEEVDLAISWTSHVLTYNQMLPGGDREPLQSVELAKVSRWAFSLVRPASFSSSSCLIVVQDFKSDSLLHIEVNVRSFFLPLLSSADVLL